MKNKMDYKTMEHLLSGDIAPYTRSPLEKSIKKVNAKVALDSLPKSVQNQLNPDFELFDVYYQVYSPGERAIEGVSAKIGMKFSCKEKPAGLLDLYDDCTNVILNISDGSPNLLQSLNFDYKDKRFSIGYFLNDAAPENMK